MAIVLALPKLYDDVVARFEAEAPGAVKQSFGWREPPKQRVGPSIVWVPGAPGGSIGKIGPARNPGRNPRPLGTLEELFHVFISGHAPSAHEDERAQYQAARELFDAWYRAVYLAARGTFEVLSNDWQAVGVVNQRRHGAAIRVVCTIQAMVPDQVFEAAPVDTVAEINVDELDVSEQQTIEAEEA